MPPLSPGLLQLIASRQLEERQRFPNTFANETVETPAGPAPLDQFLRCPDSLFRPIQPQTAKPGQEASAEALRTTIERSLAAFRAVEELDFTIRPRNRFQRWKVRLEQALNPTYEIERQVQEQQIKTQLRSMLGNQIVTAAGELRRIEAEDPAMEEFRRRAAGEVGEALAQSQREQMAFARLLAVEQGRQRIGLPGLGEDEREVYLRSFLDVAQAPAASDPLERQRRLQGLVEAGADVESLKAIPELRITDADVRALEEVETERRRKATLEAERAETAKAENLTRDLFNEAQDLQSLSRRPVTMSIEDPESGQVRQVLRDVPILEFTDALRKAAELKIRSRPDRRVDIETVMGEFLGGASEVETRRLDAFQQAEEILRQRGGGNGNQEPE